MQAPQPQERSALDSVAHVLLRRHIAEVREAGCPLLLALRQDLSDAWTVEVLGYGLDLLGYRADCGVDALGLVATGRAQPLGAPVEPAAKLSVTAACKIELACVVSRGGAVGWQAFSGEENLLSQAPTSGLLLDCMLRALGASTSRHSHCPATWSWN